MEIEQTQDADALAILKNIEEGREEFEEADDDNDDIKLPSDEVGDVGDDNDTDTKKELYAGKYKSIDELKKGIKNLNNTLSDTVLNGMKDEALEQYYEELNKDFSKGKKYKIAEEVKTEPVDENKPKVVPDDVWTDLKNSFNTTGGLTEAQYAKLGKLGIPEQIVDEYLDGLVAKQVQTQNEMYEIAGSKEQYETIKVWAISNIDSGYLDAVGKMNLQQMKVALKGIKAQYDLANSTPTRMVGNSNKSTSSGTYRSQEEYLKDVSDRRYNTDELFRKKVDSKLRSSKF